MLEKVLIATDFSPASDCLLHCAGEFKSLGLKEAVLAHVIYVANTPGLEDRLMDEVRPQIARQQRLLEEQGIKVTPELRYGVPARELDTLAEQHGANWILIGSRGRSLVKTLLGSISFRVLQVSRRPVFLSRIEVLGEGESCSISVCKRSFDNILFATDFSDAAYAAFEHLVKIAEAYRPRITLLHVLDEEFAEIHLSGQGMVQQQAKDEERLGLMKKRLEELGARVSLAWEVGKPDRAIVERTRNEDFTLVVMGNHGRGFLREALLGSVANTVARQAATPVLLVPSAP
ncbi:universal stress protein [Geoalkalibacter sp.]|uniref:universal stress protein n=1 Tax=Geoalkalibacter sp. TaxID=3041440 RepID=UPI00272E92F9|nr:universal stress protein [Geoalkalibacter sp.]